MSDLKFDQNFAYNIATLYDNIDLWAVCVTHHVHLFTHASPCASYCTVENVPRMVI